MISNTDTMVSKDYGTMIAHNTGTLIFSGGDGTMRVSDTGGESVFMDYFRKEKAKEEAAAANASKSDIPALPTPTNSEEVTSMKMELEKLENQYKMDCVQLKQAFELRRDALQAQIDTLEKM